MPTILLAEDETAIADTVLYALRAEGFTAEHVLLGGSVLPRLKQGGVDLVILDVGLPDMDGKQLATKVRELRATLPILFASGYAENIDVPDGMQVIGKPFSIDQLRDKVKSML